MNAKQACQQGLQFTGAYAGTYDAERNQEWVKNGAKEIRKAGFRAVIVQESSGKSVYAELAYFQNEEVKRLEKRIEGHEARMQGAKRRYEAELAALEKEQEDYLAAVERSKGEAK